ncbi:hypothetical protein AN219_36480 [Streptomyces nanshensis]|nr:hypothetical protein AN219_36480 [Streptomyces nanshensis]
MGPVRRELIPAAQGHRRRFVGQCVSVAVRGEHHLPSPEPDRAGGFLNTDLRPLAAMLADAGAAVVGTGETTRAAHEVVSLGKVAYWEGVSFTANAARLEPVALLDPFRSVGSELRRQLGERYVSLLIGFGAGDISGLHPRQHAPAPMAGSVEAELAAAEPARYLLDLRAPRQDPVDEWLRGTHRLRVIGGIYEAAADHEHYLTTGPLDEWFDAVLHVRTVGPTTLR